MRWQLPHLNLIPFPADDVAAPRAKPAARAKSKAYAVEEKRKVHPNAYEPWSTEDDQHLAEHCSQGASLAELSQEFGRNKGGIASRFIKINAGDPVVEDVWKCVGEDPGATL
ncbi:hypothetical protein AB0C11_32760 [Streptomyces sp. NPDC039016]|uniref:hypothetical protein n=1 Tax=Streptomyces sp. NPDC039016 TaxID=3154330 RepID=UPI00340EAC7F